MTTTIKFGESRGRKSNSQVPGISSVTFASVDPNLGFQFGNIGFNACNAAPPPPPPPTPTPPSPTPNPTPTPTPVPEDDRRVAPFPYPSPIETDTSFYASVPPGVFSQTVRKYDGPITRDVDIDRVVGERNADGTLKYPGELVSNGVVSRYATLRIPAYDVDLSAGERDHILFNGVEIGNGGAKAYLQGQDKKWFISEFQVPIELVRFGNLNPGSRPTAGHNEVEIIVDEDSGGWRVAVGAPKIQFKAMAPVVMVHGNNSCGAYFAGHWNCKPNPEDPNDPMFIQPFIDKKIPFDNSINMATDQVAVHADWLLTGGPTNKSIKRIAAEWGSKHVHIVAHSKGGIDVRHFLTWLNSGDEPGDLGVLSFTTLSSPHLGSVGADYQVAVADATALGLTLSDNRTRAALALFAPADRGTRDLTVEAVKGFNRGNFPRLPLSFTVDGETNRLYYYVIAADANLDGSSEPNSVAEKFHPEKFLPTITDGRPDANGKPTYDETRGIRVPLLSRSWTLTNVYRLLGSVREVILEPKPIPLTNQTTRVIKEIPEPCWFVPNDFAVTWLSAVAAKDDPCALDPESSNVTTRLPVATPLTGFIIKANHATMSTASTANKVIGWIQQAQPIQ